MTVTRQDILDRYWGGVLPDAPPDAVKETELVMGLKNMGPTLVGTCKVLYFQMPGGMWSGVQIFYPPPGTGMRRAAFIWHEGHGSTATASWITVGKMLALGYVVAHIAMSGYRPLVSPYENSGYHPGLPGVYTLPSGGVVLIEGHSDFPALAAAGGNVPRLLLDPIFRTITWLRELMGITKVGIGGHSGGGWSSLWAGALDERLSYIASVHGWADMGMVGQPNRDYEQTGPIAELGINFSDLSVMIGAREQHMITGDNDNIFGEAKLGTGPLNALVAGIVARGANLTRVVLPAPDHAITEPEGQYLADTWHASNAEPAFLFPAWSGALATAQDIARVVNLIDGLPGKGIGGSLVPVATWDGTGATPAGWSKGYAATATGGGMGRLDVSECTLCRMYDSAAIASLSDADRAIVVARRAEFVGR